MTHASSSSKFRNLASSRYETAALGVAEFKRWGFMDTLPGPGDAVDRDGEVPGDAA
jgi:hypothetical protein